MGNKYDFNRGGKWSLVCPKCRHEFVWSDDPALRRREELTARLNQLRKEIDKMKNAHYDTKEQYHKSKILISKLGKEIYGIDEELSMIKKQLKSARVSNDKAITDEFIDLVKEEVGEETYIRLMRKAYDIVRPEGTMELMKHTYSSKRPSTSINKL